MRGAAIRKVEYGSVQGSEQARSSMLGRARMSAKIRNDQTELAQCCMRSRRAASGPSRRTSNRRWRTVGHRGGCRGRGQPPSITLMQGYFGGAGKRTGGTAQRMAACIWWHIRVPDGDRSRQRLARGFRTPSGRHPHSLDFAEPATTKRVLLPDTTVPVLMIEYDCHQGVFSGQRSGPSVPRAHIVRTNGGDLRTRSAPPPPRAPTTPS